MNLLHRGATGADPDGRRRGLLIRFRRFFREAKRLFRVAGAGKYGMGFLFLPPEGRNWRTRGRVQRILFEEACVRWAGARC